MPDWEIDPATLEIGAKVGQGEFGAVHKVLQHRRYCVICAHAANFSAQMSTWEFGAVHKGRLQPITFLPLAYNGAVGQGGCAAVHR